MLKTKQRRFAIVAILVFSMIAMYGGVPTVSAASMDSAKTLLGDSDVSATNDVEVTFNLGVEDLDAATDYIEVEFAAQFNLTGVVEGNITCPNSGTPTLAGQIVTCTADGGTVASTSDQTITIPGVVNPGTPNDYTVTITSFHLGAVEIETAQTKVYVINDVTMSATVAASLTFAIHGTTSNAVINGDTTMAGATSSPNEIAFGTVESGTEYRMGQQLEVSTNATGGFTVTVQQDGNMVNGGGADINEFASSSPTDWTSPLGNLDEDWTYGHMGVASDDSDLDTPFPDGFYQGLDGTNPLEVMSHDGPADGATQDKGLASVMYNLEISDLQEAGDYENTLTYVCTPTF